MFYYLEGKVAHVEPYLAVIDCGGVGYACRTTNHTIRQLKKGEVKRLYTYLNVGDGIFELYGFATEQELNSFKLLIGVSGVGPKAALAILSVGTPEHLTMAVITGDEKALTAASGVGKKLAQRILLELKDKIAKETQEIGLPASAGGAALGSGSKAAEAAAALEGKPVPPLPPLAERCAVAVRQIRMAAAYKGERVAVLEARKQYCWYLKGISHANYYKEQIVQMNTLEDVDRITRGIQRDLRD